MKLTVGMLHKLSTAQDRIKKLLPANDATESQFAQLCDQVMRSATARRELQQALTLLHFAVQGIENVVLVGEEEV